MANIIKYNVTKDGTKITYVNGGGVPNNTSSSSSTDTPTYIQFWQNSTGAKSLIPFESINLADGINSVAVGTNTQTLNEGEMAVGTYNKSLLDSTIFTVGDGDSSDNRHNVFQACRSGITATNGVIEGNLQANYGIFENAKVNGLLNTNKLQALSGYIKTLLSEEITTDYLTVTKAAHFFKLIIDEIKATQGAVIITPANAKLDYVDDIEGGWRCYYRAKDDDGNQIYNCFEVDDQVVCQTFNASTGTSYNISNKYYWRKVTATGSTAITIDGQSRDVHYFDLSSEDCDLSSMTPSIGDECVQLGNRTDTTRQAAIVISAYNSEFLDKGLKAPSIAQYAGINDYNLGNHRLNIISNGLNQFKGAYSNNSGQDIENIIATTASTLDGKITTLNGTVSSHTQSISELVQTDSELKSSISSNTQSIGTLNDNLGIVSGAVSSNTSSISTLQQTASSLTSTVSSHTQSITTINNNINGLSGSISSNTASISTLEQTADNIKTTVSANTTDISSLSGTVDTQGTDISNLSGTVTSHTESISTLNQTASGLSSTVSSHTQSISGLSGDVSTNSTNINSLSGSVTANTESISKLEQTSSSLTSTISSHTQNISTLSGDVGTIKNDYVTSSKLEQTASGISATVTSDIEGKLLNTGINITTNKITMSSDNTEFVSASGSKTWLVGKNSTGGTIFKLGRYLNSQPRLELNESSSTYSYLWPTTLGMQTVNASSQSVGMFMDISDGYPHLQMVLGGNIFHIRVYDNTPQWKFGASTAPWHTFGAGKVKFITGNTSTYTLEDDVEILINKVTSRDITINLPTPSQNTGRKVYVKARGNNFWLSGIIQGSDSKLYYQTSIEYGGHSIMLVCDGECWIVYNCV